MNQPYFTIVIPTYNRAHLIVKTIESVLNQKFKDFELIIVDDGSLDNTEFVVAPYLNSFVHYYKKKNAERAAARNFGILKSKGKYVTFCDSDDILYPDYLSNAFETIGKNENVNWMHLAYEIKRNDGKSIKMAISPKNFILEIAKGNPLSCMGVFVRHDIIIENLFNENRHLSGSEDWELWLRIASRYEIVFDQRVSSALIIHDERSVTQTDELKLQLRKYLSIGFAFDNQYVKSTFQNYKIIMYSYFDTYIALHLLLSGKSLSSIKYLILAVKNYPLCVFERRFLVILKYLILNFLGLVKQDINVPFVK